MTAKEQVEPQLGLQAHTLSPGDFNEHDRFQKGPDATGGGEVESRRFCLFLDKLSYF